MCEGGFEVVRNALFPSGTSKEQRHQGMLMLTEQEVHRLPKHYPLSLSNCFQ